MTALPVRAGLALRLALVLAVVDVAGAFLPSEYSVPVLPLIAAELGAVTLGAAAVVLGRHRTTGLVVVAVSRAVAALVALVSLSQLGAFELVVVAVLDVVAALVLGSAVRTTGARASVPEPRGEGVPAGR